MRSGQATAPEVYPGDDALLASYPIKIDLAREEAREQADFKSRLRPFFLIYTGLGFAIAALGALLSLGFFGGNLVIGLVTIVAGVGFAILMLVLPGRILGQYPVGISLTQTRLEIVRANGATVAVDWDNPSFKVDLAELTGNPQGILPRNDARWTRPQWIDVFQPPSRMIKVETTLPIGATATILREAGRRGLTVTPVRVAFWWHSAPKSPGWLDHDVEGALRPKHALNGQIFRIRGPAWANVPEPH